MGKVTTTPRSGWITTRRRRARGERRRVYGTSPPGSRTTSSVSVATVGRGTSGLDPERSGGVSSGGVSSGARDAGDHDAADAIGRHAAAAEEVRSHRGES
jgi:hypothetical protein